MRRGLLAIVAAGVAGGASATQSPPAEVAAIPVAMLTDLGSGQVLYARNPDLRFVPASVTKAMTAYVAFGLIARGDLAEDRPFTVDPGIAREWKGKGTSLYLGGGQTVPADLLIRGITTVSANDAAVTLAQGYAGSIAAWAELMNREAGLLGMSSSHFATPNGWPDGGATYVTARDLTRLGAALVTRYPDDYHRYFGQKRLTWNGLTQLNKDPAIGFVRGADGIKTGHTGEAGFNYLGSAERDGRRLMMVIAGASNEAERAAASRALLEWGFSAWEARPLLARGMEVARAKVQAGDRRGVGLVAGRALQAVFPRGSGGAVSLILRYRGPLTAPIAKGAQVAELEVRTAAGLPGRVPLYASEAVGAAGPLDRLWNGLAGLFG